MKRLVIACILFLGCRDENKSNSNTTNSTQPTPVAAKASTSMAAPSAEALVALDCLPCHDKLMLEQQRLTAKQWGAVVKKMQGWGSQLAPDDIDQVVTYLSNQYPATGPEYIVPSVPITEVAARFGVSPDGPFGIDHISISADIALGVGHFSAFAGGPRCLSPLGRASSGSRGRREMVCSRAAHAKDRSFQKKM
jgi:hypothetical protein